MLRSVPGAAAPLLAAALLAAGCRDAAGPERSSFRGPALATTAASAITLDQQTGTLNDGIPWGTNGTHVGKGFELGNPHPGDAIVATFFWQGSTNTIDTVTDHLSDGTLVGNKYVLVEYVTAGGVSMATYVATNVQGFPYPNTDPSKVLDVHAIFTVPITEGGVMLSAYSGVGGVTAAALAAHQSAAGSGASTPTVADPGAIPVSPDGLAYGVTMGTPIAGVVTPPDFTNITTMSDAAIVTDGEYTLRGPGGGSADPKWSWSFQSPSTWLASVVALNPAATQLIFATQPSTTLPLFTIKPPVQVVAADDVGTTVASATGSVTIAIGHNGGMLMPGHLSGTTTVPLVNGVATFSDLSIDQPGNGYTLLVTASGLRSAESAAFNIGAF